MAKYLINPLELKIEFTIENGDVILESSAHYGIGSEKVEMRRGMEITYTPTQEQQIKQFVKGVVLPQIKANEELT